MERIKYNLLKKSTTNSPEVSIIIRCKNEGKYIKKCLDMIQSQIIDLKYEIIVIDSGSSDDTIKVASEFNLSLYTINSNDFNFGTSVNLGIRLSEGRYCVFLSAHAIPYDENWLRELVYPLLSDDKIAGSYSKQIYYEDTFILEKRSLEDTFKDTERLQRLDDSKKGSFNNIKSEIVFSNSSSCIRKSIADKFPFIEICASEDREWALRVLNEGYKIFYAPKSKVYHAHNESPKQWYDRIYINSKALYQFTGVFINIFHVIPIYFLQIYKDFKFAFSHKIKINISTVKQFIIYEFYYVLAHYNGSR